MLIALELYKQVMIFKGNSTLNLRSYGIGGMSLNWIVCYTKTRGCFQTGLRFTSGIPQGGLIG